jgi:hypothetical protein
VRRPGRRLILRGNDVVVAAGQVIKARKISTDSACYLVDAIRIATVVPMKQASTSGNTLGEWVEPVTDSKGRGRGCESSSASRYHRNAGYRARRDSKSPPQRNCECAGLRTNRDVTSRKRLCHISVDTTWQSVARKNDYRIETH